jgi:hypothetical protein
MGVPDCHVGETIEARNRVPKSPILNRKSLITSLASFQGALAGPVASPEVCALLRPPYTIWHPLGAALANVCCDPVSGTAPGSKNI